MSGSGNSRKSAKAARSSLAACGVAFAQVAQRAGNRVPSCRGGTAIEACRNRCPRGARPNQCWRSSIIFLISAIALAGFRSFGQASRAVHDRVAAIEPERILELVEPLAGGLVARVDDPAIGRSSAAGPEVAVAVPPVARAGRRAARAQDARRRPVDLLLVFLRLQALAIRRRRRARLQPRLDRRRTARRSCVRSGTRSLTTGMCGSG